MPAESPNPDPDRVERDTVDFVRELQQGGNDEANLEGIGYPELPAAEEREELTPDEEVEAAEASLRLIEPTPDVGEQSDEDEARRWPPDIEKQVELGRINANQADMMVGRDTSDPPESEGHVEQPPRKAA